MKGSRLPGIARSGAAQLRPYATLAGYVLAIIGAMSLGRPLINRAFEMLVPAEIMGAARPVCEDLPFVIRGVQDSERLKLMGVDIKAEKPLSHLRVSMDGILEVKYWGMQSDGISTAEQKEFIARLPTGIVSPPIVTPEFPSIPAGTSTQLLAIVKKAKGNCLDGRWLDTQIPTGKVYVTDPSEQVARDLDFVYDVGSPRRIGFMALLIVIPLFLIKRWRGIVRYLAKTFPPRHP